MHVGNFSFSKNRINVSVIQEQINISWPFLTGVGSVVFHLHRQKAQQSLPGLHSRRQALVMGPLSAPGHVSLTDPALQYKKVADTNFVGLHAFWLWEWVGNWVKATFTKVEIFLFLHSCVPSWWYPEIWRTDFGQLAIRTVICVLMKCDEDDVCFVGMVDCVKSWLCCIF